MYWQSRKSDLSFLFAMQKSPDLVKTWQKSSRPWSSKISRPFSFSVLCQVRTNLYICVNDKIIFFSFHFQLIYMYYKLSHMSFLKIIMKRAPFVESVFLGLEIVWFKNRPYCKMRKVNTTFVLNLNQKTGKFEFKGDFFCCHIIRRG